MFEITSTQNQKYKYIKSLLQKKERVKNGEYTVEGIKSVSDAAAANADIVCIAKSSEVSLGFDAGKVPVYNVDQKIFPGLCDTKSPQGVIAVIKMPKAAPLPNGGKFVYCDRISDPGNLGTIIRTADAAGFEVIMSPGCADLYSPKTIRSSMGSFFHTKVYENVGYEELKKSGMRLIAGALCSESKDYRTANYGGSVALIVGNEANGVSEELLSVCDEKVIIPIIGRAESLNAAVAAAIMMYEAIR